MIRTLQTSVILLMLTASASALTCPAGFVELADSGIPNATTGQLYSGRISVTRPYNAATSQGDQQVVTIAGGAVDQCIATGPFRVIQQAVNSTLRIPFVWIVPDSGGPYRLRDIQASGPIPPQLVANVPTGQPGMLIVNPAGDGFVWAPLSGALSLATLTDGQLAALTDSQLSALTD